MKETNPEAEIYEAINRIEFQFGKETHTVGEANLLFAYEVGLDLFTVYVIALSEHYGAIVFYLPEDLTREIARHLPPDETFQRYIANLIERQAGLRNINTVLKGFGMVAKRPRKHCLNYPPRSERSWTNRSTIGKCRIIG